MKSVMIRRLPWKLTGVFWGTHVAYLSTIQPS